MSMHERETHTFRELSNALNELLLEYGDELGDLPVLVEDDDGIYESPLIAVDLAGGLFIIVETQELIQDYNTEEVRELMSKIALDFYKLGHIDAEIVDLNGAVEMYLTEFDKEET